MKKLKILLLLMFSIYGTYSSAQDSLVVFSRTSETQVVRMRIRFVDGVAYVKKDDVTQECKKEDNPTLLYNATDLECSFDEKGDCYYSIPPGHGYWAVPFINEPPFAAINDCKLVCQCRSCDSSPATGGCKTRTIGRSSNCDTDNCSGWCDGSMICGGTGYWKGGGVLLHVNSVVYE